MRPLCDSYVLESTRANGDTYSDIDSNNNACRGSDPVTPAMYYVCAAYGGGQWPSLRSLGGTSHGSLVLFVVTPVPSQVELCVGFLCLLDVRVCALWPWFVPIISCVSSFDGRAWNFIPLSKVS